MEQFVSHDPRSYSLYFDLKIRFRPRNVTGTFERTGNWAGKTCNMDRFCCKKQNYSQRKAARFCLQNFSKTASVTDMLSDLKWDTLETRRKKNRLTLMYKLSHNLVDINTEEHLIPNSELRTRNSHAFKYRMPKVSKDVFKFSFFPRSITEWNSLPADLVNCNSLSDFKLNLGKHVK